MGAESRFIHQGMTSSDVLDTCLAVQMTQAADILLDDMDKLLAELAKRVGFRLAPGLGERVVYREMFLKGLTLLDIRQEGAGMALSMSHVAARQELRTLVEAIGLAPAQ